jgi:MobA/MobL family
VADYRLSVQTISRADGRNAVAAAAYRAGEELSNERNGQTYDYTRRGGVLHTEIIAPETAPDWVHDRERLWNEAERSELRINSRVAREVQLSLPHELTAEQRKELVTEFVRDNFVAKGMVADVAIHAPSKDGDQRNYHAHVMLTTRIITPNGFTEKQRDWNSTEVLSEWRENWATAQNRHLTRALGARAPQVTHKSYAEQGIDKIPGHHLGPGAAAMERRHQASRRGDLHRESRVSQDRIKVARERQDTLQAQFSPPVEKSMAEAVMAISGTRQELEMQLEAHSQQLSRTLAEMKGKRNITVNSIEKTAMEPFEKEVKKAKRDLEMARDRAGLQATPRTIMYWFKNPSSQMWQSMKRSAEIDAASAKLNEATKSRDLAQKWLKSEPGMKYTLGQYREQQPRLQELRTDERKARRNIAQVSRHLKTAQTLEKTTRALMQSGLAPTVSIPERGLDSGRYLKAFQTGINARMQALAPQQQQTLAQILTRGILPSLSRGR